MRVLLAPDKFAGTATAPQVAEALAAGWRQVRPGDDLTELPLSDGGPGFLDALAALPGAVARTVTVPDPLGRPTRARIVSRGTTAYVECADPVGRHLVEPGRSDPLRASTSGLGLLLRAAAAGAGTVVVGLGGSATVDGGVGMLQGLGYAVLDAAGTPVGPGASGMLAARSVVPPPTGPPAVRLVAASDVRSPLCGPAGAAAVFGPQKGLASGDVGRVDEGLAAWAAVLRRGLGAPADLVAAPGGGAAGGIGAALLALGATVVDGFGTVAAAVDLDARVAAADLVVTGEGRLDASSLVGKVVGQVVDRCAAAAVPVVVVAGDAERDTRAVLAVRGVAVRTLADAAGSAEAAMSDAGAWLGRAGAAAAYERTSRTPAGWHGNE